MKKIRYYCDRCKKEIQGPIVLGTIFGNVDVPEDDWDLERGAELCEICYKAVDDVVMKVIRGVNMVPAGTKVEIDMGKVFALRKAGWNLDKIGTEFGVTGVTIANRIKAYEAAHKEDE